MQLLKWGGGIFTFLLVTFLGAQFFISGEITNRLNGGDPLDKRAPTRAEEDNISSAIAKFRNEINTKGELRFYIYHDIDNDIYGAASVSERRVFLSEYSVRKLDIALLSALIAHEVAHIEGILDQNKADIRASELVGKNSVLHLLKVGAQKDRLICETNNALRERVFFVSLDPCNSIMENWNKRIEAIMSAS